jgi:hypothetical protein
MKIKVLFGVLLVVGFAEGAVAACGGGTRVNGNDAVANLLRGKTVCHRTPGNPDWNWQEYHNPNKTLTDYKRGPFDPVDHSEDVGNWSTENLGTVQNRDEVVIYDYGTGGKYSYRIYNQGGTYDFCAVQSGGTDVTGATLVEGNGGCGDQSM